MRAGAAGSLEEVPERSMHSPTDPAALLALAPQLEEEEEGEEGATPSHSSTNELAPGCRGAVIGW